MTRDEARSILAGRYIVNIDGEDEYCEKANEALDMAIEALTNQQKWIDEELQNYLIENADLVTCQDCVYAEHRSQMPRQIYCHRETWSLSCSLHDDDDFCKWAERRE